MQLTKINIKMKVTGTITKILAKETGTTKTGGVWEKQFFVLDNNEKYNNIFCFEIFGAEKVENFNKYNKVGSMVDVDFNVQTNEWKDRHFTTLQAWKVFKAESGPAPFKTTEEIKNIEVESDDLQF